MGICAFIVHFHMPMGSNMTIAVCTMKSLISDAKAGRRLESRDQGRNTVSLFGSI